MAVTPYTMSVTENTKKNGKNSHSSFGFLVTAPVDAGGITALTGALSTNLGLAVDGVTLGVVYKQSAKLFEQLVSDVRPANVAAQKENRWLVTGTDGTKSYQFSIGTADPSLIADGENEMAAGAPRAALVSALEAMWKGEGGAPVTVSSIRYIGRSA